MADGEIEGYYLQQGKDMTELLYDKRFLNDDLSLKSVEWLSQYMALVMQQQAKSAAKVAEFTAKMRDKKGARS